MKIVLTIALVILLWLIFYLLVRKSGENVARRVRVYKNRMQTDLDNLFYARGERFLQTVLVVLPLVAGLVGFVLPGKVSEFENRISIDRAADLNKKGYYDKAVAILENLKGLDSPLVQNELGYAHLGNKSYERAEAELKTAIRILPTYSTAHLNLAAAYARLGKNIDASFELSRAKETSKYTLPTTDLYRVHRSFWDNIVPRCLLGGILALLGFALPGAVIKILKKRRVQKYEIQLADGLLMASNALRAGFSLVQALEMVSKETQPPLSQEFGLVLKEHRLGYPLEDALMHLTERIANVDTKIFVNTILILRETGGNLTELFDTIVNTIQERRRVQKKVRTMTAEGEAQAVILALMPIVLGLILNHITPEVFSLLYTTFPGWMLIILMTFMEVLGFFWMYKMVKVKI